MMRILQSVLILLLFWKCKPSQEEIDAWDERVLQILKDLEEMNPNNDDDNGVNQKILVRTMLLTRLDLIGMASQVQILSEEFALYSSS
jgi:hypothetical protein